eukprot:scaffold569_cov408-Prasinococcus_capsulatus_cf.AAC.28
MLVVDGEPHYSPFGAVLVFISTLGAGVRWVAFQKLTSNIGHNAVRQRSESIRRSPVCVDMVLTRPVVLAPQVSKTAYTMPWMAATTTILSLSLENWKHDLQQPPYFDSRAHWASTLVCHENAGAIGGSGVVALCIIVSEFQLLHLLGPVALAVLGVVKDLGTISVGIFVFGDRFTWTKAFGLILTFAGVCVFKVYTFYYGSHFVPRDAMHHQQAAGSSEAVAPLAQSTRINKFTLVDEDDYGSGEENGISIKTV